MPPAIKVTLSSVTLHHTLVRISFQPAAGISKGWFASLPRFCIRACSWAAIFISSPPLMLLHRGPICSGRHGRCHRTRSAGEERSQRAQQKSQRTIKCALRGPLRRRIGSVLCLLLCLGYCVLVLLLVLTDLSLSLVLRYILGLRQGLGCLVRRCCLLGC